MNEMTTFDFCDSLHQNHPVRMIEQNGEPWWVLKDVCEALNLKNATLVAKRLDNDELTKLDLGSRQGETIIAQRQARGEGVQALADARGDPVNPQNRLLRRTGKDAAKRPDRPGGGAGKAACTGAGANDPAVERG